MDALRRLSSIASHFLGLSSSPSQSPQSEVAPSTREPEPRFDFHHAHLFCSDLSKTVDWWTRHLNAKVIFDGELAGSRNVFIAVGSGRLHLYDQPPRDSGCGAVHHLGIRVEGLRNAWDKMKADGVSSKAGLRDHDDWRYVMVEAPDGVLLELFEFDDPNAPTNVRLPGW